jgi:hypothetical protein
MPLQQSNETLAVQPIGWTWIARLLYGLPLPFFSSQKKLDPVGSSVG